MKLEKMLIGKMIRVKLQPNIAKVFKNHPLRINKLLQKIMLKIMLAVIQQSINVRSMK